MRDTLPEPAKRTPGAVGARTHMTRFERVIGGISPRFLRKAATDLLRKDRHGELSVEQVPADWVRHAADRLGPDSAAVTGALAAAGLARPEAAGEERVPCSGFVAFLEAAARLTGDDLLGLNLGVAYDLRASGLGGYAVIAAPTVRAALRAAVRYGALRDTGAVHALAEGAGVARFRIEHRSARFRASRHATEFKAGMVLAAGLRWVGQGFRPAEMRFAHPRGASRPAVERRFGCPVRFGAAATEMLFASGQLDMPMRGADPYLAVLVGRHAEAALAGVGPLPGSLRGGVERTVTAALPGGVPTLEQVAEGLGLGPRTLARRLADEGTSYRRLVDALRRDMATNLLADPDLDLAQIAELLGYAEQSAFTNAFRRWTGQPPRRFRMLRREAESAGSR